MRRIIVFAALTLAAPLDAMAHVTVNPRVSKLGAQETYTVRVPTEKQVATTSVDLEVPDGVTISRVSDMDGARHEEKRTGDRVVVVTWTKEIKPRKRADFTFVAINPASNTDVTWTIRQHYADGSISNWTPATKITDVSAEAPATGAGATQSSPAPETSSIETWLKQYDAAFNANDLDKLATFYHPDVTIYKGSGINDGWVDYRDNHLGPELKEFQNLQFGHTNTRVTVLGDGRGAYVTSNYLKGEEHDVDSGGLETLVLVKGTDGAWRIRHSHTSRYQHIADCSPCYCEFRALQQIRTLRQNQRWIYAAHPER